MPSFGDSIFLFVLALILFGPKKLPELARQLGKLMGEFRRASNEFRSQMEEELRIADQAERQKQIAAIEAAAPAPALATPVPATEIPHTIAPPTTNFAAGELTASEPTSNAAAITEPAATQHEAASDSSFDAAAQKPDRSTTPSSPAAAPTLIPIAVSGELRIMPPATGLPTGNSSLSALINSVPHAADPATAAAESAATANEEALHG